MHFKCLVERFLVSSAGDCTGVSFTSTSSKRYKTNIRSLTGNLDKILQLSAVRYDSTVRVNDTNDIGMIAEDVVNVIPEIVYDDPDYPGELAGIDYGRLTTVLAGAIQEMRAEYQAQIATLQSQVVDLSSKL